MNVRGVMLLAAAATLPSIPVSAQGPGQPGIVDPRSEPRLWSLREVNLRTMRPGTDEPLTAEEQRVVDAMAAQLREDFAQIQLARNAMLETLRASKGIDFGVLASKAKDVNKRAKRLVQYLSPDPDAVPEPQVDDDAEATPLRVRNDAVVLCHTITSLVENPAFASSTAGSAEAAAANRDLLRVMYSSDKLRRDAERVARSR